MFHNPGRGPHIYLSVEQLFDVMQEIGKELGTLGSGPGQDRLGREEHLLGHAQLLLGREERVYRDAHSQQDHGDRNIPRSCQDDKKQGEGSDGDGGRHYTSEAFSPFRVFLPGTDIRQPSPGWLVVQIDDASQWDALASSIMEALMKAGCHIRAFNRRDPRLEDIYMAYVGGGSK